jgi:nucleoside-diphosphate-sugar epimerase
LVLFGTIVFYVKAMCAKRAQGDGMRVAITGGAGVLGRMLAARLLAGEHARAPLPFGGSLTELVLIDQGDFALQHVDTRVTSISGDVTDPAVTARVFKTPVDAVFHLAAVVSAGAEADFDLGMHVNLDGLRNVLQACRAQRVPPRVVFTSSVAAFGGELPAVVDDETAVRPQSSYGTQKVIGELLVADMTRKGFIDGRTVRLPTIVVRPGKPNRAASGFMSNILREPMNGEPAVCPVPPDARMWILSPAGAIDVLVHAAALGPDQWGWNRTLNAPGLSVSVAEALAALERIVGAEARALVRFERDPSIERIVLSWPAKFVTERAGRLGFHADRSIDDIIRAHLRTLER